MTHILMIIDGMTDCSYPELANKTPYEYAACEHMEFMKQNGAYGTFSVCPKGFPVDSLSCILTLLGVPSEQLPQGRAYFEALAYGIPINDTDLILRCNLTSIQNGRLVSSCSESLTEAQFRKAAELMNERLDSALRLVHMSAYKNLLLIKDGRKWFDALTTYAPHESLGTKFTELYPYAPSELQGKLQYFIQTSEQLLSETFGGGMRYAYLPWGASYRQDIPSFESLHGMHASAVCATEIVKGIGVAMGMDVPAVANATADIDTDLAEKLRMTLRQAKRTPFVLLHFNGTDEAAHRRRPKEKAEFIGKIDRELIGPLLEQSDSDTKILITSDHSTYAKTGEHAGDPQPFILYQKNQSGIGDIGNHNGRQAVKLLKEYGGRIKA